MSETNVKPKVLFIEDDPQQMDILNIYFERNGIETERCYDGADGISVASGWQPDMIVLDMRMEGMDGLAVMQALQGKSETKDIPVIAYTNYETSDVKKPMLDLGAIAVWEKTMLRPPELVRKLKAFYTIIENNSDSDKADTLNKLREAALQ